MRGVPKKVWRTAGDIVERARAGDQVAMAILAEVRDYAKAGKPRARASLRVIEQYIQENPPVHFGVCDVTHSPEILRLWSLGSAPIDVAEKALSEDLPQVTFWQGVVALVHAPVALFESWKVPAPFEKMFNLSRAIRRLSDSSVPIAAFCPVTAWELGE